MVGDDEGEGDEGEDEDAVCAAAAAAGVEAEVVAVLAGGVAPRDEILGGAGRGSVLRCEGGDVVEVFDCWFEDGAFY